MNMSNTRIKTRKLLLKCSQRDLLADTFLNQLLTLVCERDISNMLLSVKGELYLEREDKKLCFISGLETIRKHLQLEWIPRRLPVPEDFIGDVFSDENFDLRYIMLGTGQRVDMLAQMFLSDCDVTSELEPDKTFTQISREMCKLEVRGQQVFKRIKHLEKMIHSAR